MDLFDTIENSMFQLFFEVSQYVNLRISFSRHRILSFHNFFYATKLLNSIVAVLKGFKVGIPLSILWHPLIFCDFYWKFTYENSRECMYKEKKFKIQIRFTILNLNSGICIKIFLIISLRLHWNFRI